jgi:hypothetical protein
MKLSINIAILVVLFSAAVYAQKQTTFAVKYFDENYQPITS